MKKVIKLACGLALSIGCTAAMANTMSCYVDTPKYDEFTTNQCDAIVWGANIATAVFRVDDAPSGSRILWSDNRCSDTSNMCMISIHAFRNYTMKATVLKPDGTWHQVSASASFEDGR
ncbi:hypothetical protein [Pseudoalteromonas tunicata]|jgi:hypothetical protein|uniref:Orphan protein n=1 Tax=Pseudoalteromonas tunicata D2 TaxID=87626 RepID=A4CCP6_9GAMM|nr:hypothetical protein [Pseudoalteromonas tunicata]ATC93841.1 hypothetical protein PTUN_a1172 [Pseudoalteromonas tunicata]AXT29653.1 hypothetical protein D1819_01675 [Pseudoalteromonas tunicata]EAR27339.1 hypothetical protein PTD2_14907 [Pseudoalteromonas tunicata D2]MDP4985829.1 hypothetical protein [Pseudoalteromonas tunicata]MDP5212848.1 hypothetical protein [Pseudoalteromonas tunicata]